MCSNDFSDESKVTKQPQSLLSHGKRKTTIKITLCEEYFDFCVLLLMLEVMVIERMI